MEKTLGIDLGTNSIGLALREATEFTWYGVYTFKKGVGEGKSGEFSFAAERTKHRASRRLYNARRYRKWETLKVLIENDYCPLAKENLDKWMHYVKGVGRKFPIDDTLFQEWIKLDFNGDGVPDFSSPHQLRRMLLNELLDNTIPENRYKIGRAFFHISQRRGFKSSRKNGSNEKTAVYQGSDETKTIGRNEYENLIIANGSLGAALAFLEDQKIRVRNRYTLRSDYQQEVEKILNFQRIEDKVFCSKIVKAIFFQRPLRSQKGTIGKCTLEPGKIRCQISHPKFEEYRAWDFINKIKYRVAEGDPYEPIPLELKNKIYNEKFFYKSKREFPFKEIRKFILANGGKDWILNYSTKMDDISIPSCFVSARLKSVFGENWEKYEKIVTKTHENRTKVIKYTIQDIWHILFNFDDEEYFIDFLTKVIELEEEQIKELLTLFNSFPSGYSNLSLKAINNILPFLREGMIYSEAVIFAKIPELMGKDQYDFCKEKLIFTVQTKIKEVRFQKTVVTIVNNLIFKYYALDFDKRFGWKDSSYKIDESDLRDIEKTSSEYFGNVTWNFMATIEKQDILDQVKKLYQEFFSSLKRNHKESPHLVNAVKELLIKEYKISPNSIHKLYHPSQIDIFPKDEGQQFLLSPKTGSFKNPMAYKTLYRLRDVINYLIKVGIIDTETRIVVEIARELNDSNKRWAIEKYQREREAENLEFANAISELIKDPEFSGKADPNSSADKDKFRLWFEQTGNWDDILKTIQSINKDKKLTITERDINKYRLWKEQDCRCLYTGKIIKITDLFDSNKIDFEHTIPRSKSFDNSLANLTVCYAHYNRSIKNNLMPLELPNYKTDINGYSAILPRLEVWEKKVESLYQQIDFWKFKSRTAADKTSKDDAIRQKHLRQMQFDYWNNKVQRFKQTEISQGFINSQLTDTQIITKYAFHYLKTVFNQVDVIKGTNTAVFRKIFKIQAKLEQKDRSTHVHHAIDAAVLTLIPVAKKREEILRKSFEFEEANFGKQYHEKPFSGFGFEQIEDIKKQILVNNLAEKDQVLTPGRKIVRKRGQIVWIDQENRIPKIAQGDSIRGELHLQTYYGKIKIAAKNEKGGLARNDNGDILYNQVEGKDEIWMVLRKPIDKVNFASDIIVDVRLAEYLKKQVAEGVNQNDLIDFKGCKLRHLRCRVKSARGFMNPDNATLVKEHTYKSEKEYKNYVYADSGENYIFGLYENNFGRDVKSINKFEASKYLKTIGIPGNKQELFKLKEPVLIRNEESKLIHVFEVGQKVIFYESIEALKEIENDSEELSKRLYFIKRLHQASVGNILFQHHLEARTDEELSLAFPKEIFKSAGKDGFSSYQHDFIAPRLLFKPSKPNFIIEGKDFDMKLDGKIIFKF